MFKSIFYVHFKCRTSSLILSPNFYFRILQRNYNWLPKIDDFQVKNEPILQYLPGSQERQQLTNELNNLMSNLTEIPIVINGREIKPPNNSPVKYRSCPFDHRHKLAKFHDASEELINEAIESSQTIRNEWESYDLNEKIKIFLKAADLVSGKYRQRLNAATMLGQGKTVIQAEIDSAAELTDFLRFNAYFAKELCKYQPLSHEHVKNTYRFRGLEGFVASISPFNFTAIGGNLSSSPTLMGNVVLWKPSEASILSNYFVFQILKEAGIPDGVINFIPSSGPTFGKAITNSKYLSGINFTGSVPTFQKLWRNVADNLDNYLNFPRLIGECGGKNYHLIHESADIEAAVAATIRSAFEYSGQKCSACSRLYVPDNLWPKIKDELLSIRNELKLSSPLEFDTFLSSVIDDKSFERIQSYLSYVNHNNNEFLLLGGGKCDNSFGYYIEPTIIQSLNPKSKLMTEEIFGPVLTVFVYKSNQINETLQLINETSDFGLTGAIFANDKDFIIHATEVLKMSAGNYYINDKSTGAIVNQQPFGGGRMSGTNDKAGGMHYLLRWTSPQNIKHNLITNNQWKYDYMQ